MPFPPFTPAEQAGIQEVLQFQWLFAPPSSLPTNVPPAQELHIAFDGAGLAEFARAIHPACGGTMTQPMVAAAASASGCHIVHNHPSQSSLSDSDWLSLAAHPDLQMTAVNSEGTTFRGRILHPPRFHGPATNFASCWSHVLEVFEAQVSAWYQSDWNLAAFGTANGWMAGRAIGEHLKASGYAEFECLANCANALALTDPEFPKLDRFLEQLCQQVIV